MMRDIAQFYPVSRERLAIDWQGAFANQDLPDEIRLPRRATSGSAGYDFYSPADFSLAPGESILLPTGVRVWMDEGWVLMIFPRSGLGFKYRLQLNNTVGIIDSDYFYAENEGHILMKLTNDSREGRMLHVHAGDGIAQGVFLPFGVTRDDHAASKRTGGFGSTDERG